MGPPTQSSISGKRACYGCVNGGMPGPRKQSSHIVSSRLRLSQLRWQTYGRMRARRWGQWRSKAKGRAKRGNGSTGHGAVGAARRPDTVLRMTLPSSWHVCVGSSTVDLVNYRYDFCGKFELRLPQWNIPVQPRFTAVATCFPPVQHPQRYTHVATSAFGSLCTLDSCGCRKKEKRGLQ